MRLRIGDLQASALQIYVTDPIFADEPFPGCVDGATLTVADADIAPTRTRLIDAANSADDDGDAEMCDALSRLVTRLRR